VCYRTWLAFAVKPNLRRHATQPTHRKHFFSVSQNPLRIFLVTTVRIPEGMLTAFRNFLQQNRSEFYITATRNQSHDVTCLKSQLSAETCRCPKSSGSCRLISSDTQEIQRISSSDKATQHNAKQAPRKHFSASQKRFPVMPKFHYCDQDLSKKQTQARSESRNRTLNRKSRGPGLRPDFEQKNRRSDRWPGCSNGIWP